MKRLLTTLFFVLSVCGDATHADTLIEPPNGFWLRSAARGSVGLYGPTDPSAKWNIAQWASPTEDLPTFEPGSCAPGACFESENSALSVSVERPEGEPLKYSFWQSGSELACTGPQNQPKEFDLFAASNNTALGPDYPFAVDRTFTLDQLSELRHRIVVTPLELHMENECPVTRGQLITAVVMRNDVAKPAQIFFYQLRLFSQPPPRRTLWWWQGDERRNKQGEVTLLAYGFGDNPSSFGETSANLGEEKEIDIDLLPRLSELITSGLHDIDPDLSHWRVTATYHGQTIWGAVQLGSKWSGFELSSELAH